MFQSICFDSFFEFAAKTMLLETEASSLLALSMSAGTKESASIVFPVEAETPIFTMPIVVSVLAFWCFSGFIPAVVRGDSRLPSPRVAERPDSP